MGLVTFSSLLNEEQLTGTFVVDTCFVINAALGAKKGSEKQLRKAFELKQHLTKNGVGLVYIGIVRNEASHYLREFLFANALAEQPKKLASAAKTYHGSRDHKLKEVMKAGYVKAFEIALGREGKLLEKELENIFFGCAYLSTEKMKPKPNWYEFLKLMATYGLDSSDAMILNFAISQKTFRGLVTMDSDFRFCSDVPGFDLVVPDYFLNLEGNKEPA